MKLFKTFTFMATLLMGVAHASVEIQTMDFGSSKEQGSLTVSYKGTLKDYPELRVSGSTIQVVIPDSKVKRAVSKKVSFATSGRDTELNMANFAGNSSRLKADFPFSMKDMADKVSLMIKENKIELNFPRVMIKAANKPAVAKKAAPKKAVPAKKARKGDYLNEDYLNSLIKMDTKPKRKVELGKVIKAKVDSDEVKTTLAATQRSDAKSSKSSFSLLEYGGKFVAFLAVTLLLFYGIVTLMKKGFIKKGKLGFLNKTDQIQVVSQTYIAPKKSLMMVKAHNQVFLVSNTEAGIHPISEIRDVAGYLKEGERKVAGDNFDDNLNVAEISEGAMDKVKLKEDITQSNKQSSLSDYMKMKDKVKFSDQIRKKAKSLKPLQ